MTERARIFISHSAADRAEGESVAVEAHAVRVAIREALAADERFRVLIDEIELKAGDMWRARINLWLGLCDAAILIISPAALKSHYVAYEANILGYRKALDPANFRIIPVLVGVRMDEVKACPLNPAQINEWQSPVTGTVQETVAGVMEGLVGLVPASSRRESRMAVELEPLLPAGTTQLKSAGAVLEIDDLPWANDDERVRLALRLLGSGMSDPCARAVRYFPEDRRFDADNLDVIGNMIAAAWVDMKAKTIPDEARSADPRPIVLNGADIRTARAYLTAARHLDFPPLKYALFEAPLITPEQKDAFSKHEQTMIEKVRAELEGKYGAGRVAEALNRAQRMKEGVFVIIHESSLTPGLLPKLRTEFPHATFFVLGGPKSESLAGDLVRITPPLDADDEKTFLERYVTFIADITSA